MPITRKIETELVDWKTSDITLAMVVDYRDIGVTCNQIKRELERTYSQIYSILRRHEQYYNVIEIPARVVDGDSRFNRQYWFPTIDGVKRLNWLFRERYDRPELVIDSPEHKGYRKKDFY